MVHALQETWRVLRPDSYAIDLRPTSKHSQVGLVQNGRFVSIAATEENLENYRAAGAALVQVKEMRLFSQCYESRFSITTTFSSLEDLREGLYDLDESVPTSSSDRLVERVEKTLRRKKRDVTIAAVVPFILRVLVKRSSQSDE
jgi:hypothetical protein